MERQSRRNDTLPAAINRRPASRHQLRRRIQNGFESCFVSFQNLRGSAPTGTAGNFEDEPTERLSVAGAWPKNLSSMKISAHGRGEMCVGMKAAKHGHKIGSAKSEAEAVGILLHEFWRADSGDFAVTIDERAAAVSMAMTVFP